MQVSAEAAAGTDLDVFFVVFVELHIPVSIAPRLYREV